MALVAFDLDSTLGTFYGLTAWAHAFSVETLENPLFRRFNHGFHVSQKLRQRLAAVEDTFIRELVKREDLQDRILRPNLDAMIRPLLAARQMGKVQAVVIYSNTWNTFSMRLAKELIEHRYQAPGLFTALIDATHPIRAHDWKRVEYGEPLKTFHTLRRIFKELCGVQGPIHRSDIVFIDERVRKHDLWRDVDLGLTYIQPSEYSPVFSERIRKEFVRVGLKVLRDTALLEDWRFIGSDVVRCIKVTYDLDLIPIQGVGELLDYIEKAIHKENRKGVAFVDDTQSLRRALIHAFSKF